MEDPFPADDPGHMAHRHATDLEDAFGYKRSAGPGSTVAVVDRAGRTTIYELVMRPPAPAPKQVTIESAEGLALLGARPGDALTIPAENGRQRRVSVVEVRPPARTHEADSPSTPAVGA
jgi:transcription elongation GreA/GreB family factor